MRYACLVYHEEEKLNALTDADLGRLVDACGEWIVELERTGRHEYSALLQSTSSAATLRGRAVMDSPCGVLSAFTVLQARDLNDAIRIASGHPAVRMGRVEVRPLLEPGVDTADPLDLRLARAMENNFS
jgi:hypothetical protein